ncbi:agamous-like MADS-box protein AGL80 [Oryza brachyantha]|uniref:MADS-box domain-containing protein n=1 Tax=Oryza brachyantha TaxID=4533 RepID=J3KYX0_ORYBR|nr:agamous-like MADS-box protein AGL80 [Oryza brachyantha]
MARNRIILKRIVKDSTRRLTLKKRRKGLIKKAGELASLCGIGVCVVVYGEEEVHPEVWPSAPETRAILSRFNAAPNVDRFKKVTNQEDYLHKRIAKVQEHMSKTNDENFERDATVMLYEAAKSKRPIADLNIKELTDLGMVIDERIKNTKEYIEHRGGAPLMEPLPMLQVEPSSMPSLVPYANGISMQGNKRMKVGTQQKGWFMNMSTMTRGGLGTSTYDSFGTRGDAGVGTSARGE